MPTWLLIVLLVLAVLVIGGYIARRRQLARSEDRFRAHLRRVDEDLAAARAEDRGWEREALEAAAREAWQGQRPGVEPVELVLIQILDRPGTDNDKASFRIGDGTRQQRLTLGRRAGEWVFERLD
jgi:hypothetical protein